jgi:hypothetical protein
VLLIWLEVVMGRDDRAKYLIDSEAWINRLKQEASEGNIEWVEPHMVHVEEIQEVSFEWWRDDRKLSVYFDAEDGIPQYIRSWGIVWGQGRHNCDDGGFSVEDSSLWLYRWLIGFDKDCGPNCNCKE